MISFFVINSLFSLLGMAKVEAAVFPIDKAEIYSKGEVVLFSYEGIGIGVDVQMYQKEGKEYPVYCLNKGKDGATEDFHYTVDITQMLSNQKTWRAIINGYPFKTPEELGCNSIAEAYAATKMAVYDSMYHYDLSEFKTYGSDLEASKRVVAAIKKIITSARNSTQTKVTATLKIQEVTTKWELDTIDKNYVSKTYQVTTSASNENYEISLTGENANRWKITDKNNQEKTKFTKGESFKILLPIVELEKAGEFTIHAKSSLKTMPVFYGKSPNPDWQNYAVTGGSYEIAEENYKQKYEENKTKIKILKQDGDTKEPLANASFHLLSTDKQLLYTELTTNHEGVIELPYLLPGDYYLEEVQAPEGYYGYDGLIPVSLQLQETVIIKIDNFKEPEEKEVPEKPIEQEVEVSKKLPRTGF